MFGLTTFGTSQPTNSISASSSPTSMPASIPLNSPLINPHSYVCKPPLTKAQITQLKQYPEPIRTSIVSLRNMECLWERHKSSSFFLMKTAHTLNLLPNVYNVFTELNPHQERQFIVQSQSLILKEYQEIYLLTQNRFFTKSYEILSPEFIRKDLHLEEDDKECTPFPTDLKNIIYEYLFDEQIILNYVDGYLNPNPKTSLIALTNLGIKANLSNSIDLFKKFIEYRISQVWYAIGTKDDKKLKELISKGYFIDEVEFKLTISLGHKEILPIIISACKKPDANWLEIAISSGMDCTPLLLKGARPNTACLKIAIEKRLNDLANHFFAMGVEPDVSCLEEAIKAKNLKLIHDCIKAGVKPNGSCFYYLFYSAELQEKQIITLFLEEGLTPNADWLSYAIGAGCDWESYRKTKKENVEQFLSMGVKPDSRCLREAMAWMPDLVPRLVQLGAVFDVSCLRHAIVNSSCENKAERKRYQQYIEIYLHLADADCINQAIYRNHDLIPKILKLGVIPDTHCFSSAAQSNNLELIKLFVSHKGVPDHNALLAALSMHAFEVIYYLLEIGVKPDSKCLGYASSHTLYRFFERFLELGATPDAFTLELIFDRWTHDARMAYDKLLEKGFKPNFLWLFSAIKSGRTDLAKTIIDSINPFSEASDSTDKKR